MLGTLVNAGAIVVGGIVGSVLRRGLRDRFKTTIIQALSLCVLMLGAATALGNMNRSDKPLLFIISLVIGGLIGEALKIEERLKAFGDKLQGSFGREGSGAEGFVAAGLIFCVGSMAILGSLQSGIQGKHDILFAKAVLDGVGSIMFAATFGPMVILAAAPVLLYQGAITLFAAALAPYTTAATIGEISIVGGVLIFGIGLNLLELTKIRIANLLPALLVPAVYYLPFVQRLLGS